MDRPNPHRSLGFLLSECSSLIRRIFYDRHNAGSMTQAQWRALAYISRHQGINQVGLSQLLEVQPITVARLVDKLTEMGLVERRQDPTDRRAQRLYLTEKAMPSIDQMWETSEELYQIAFRGFTDEEASQLTSALVRVRANLAQETPRHPSSQAPDEDALILGQPHESRTSENQE